MSSIIMDLCNGTCVLDHWSNRNIHCFESLFFKCSNMVLQSKFCGSFLGSDGPSDRPNSLEVIFCNIIAVH